jgi:hypothetical protein
MKSYGVRHICAILGGGGMFLLMARGGGLAAQGKAVPLALQDGTPVKLRLT